MAAAALLLLQSAEGAMGAVDRGGADGVEAHAQGGPPRSRQRRLPVASAEAGGEVAVEVHVEVDGWIGVELVLARSDSDLTATRFWFWFYLSFFYKPRDIDGGLLQPHLEGLEQPHLWMRSAPTPGCGATPPVGFQQPHRIQGQGCDKRQKRGTPTTGRCCPWPLLPLPFMPPP